MSQVQSLLHSYADLFEIEITTILGCPVDCSYCPQDQLKTASKGRKKRLTAEDFDRAINNIDMKVGISWTGYSEPCLSPDLPEMCESVNSRGISQVISTTLTGNDRSVEFVSSSKCFDSFTIHAPDSSGLMRGLKPDENYINKFSSCLEQMYANNQMRKVRIITFGDHFYEPLVPFIKDALTNKGLQKEHLKLRDTVSTRAGGLDSEELSNQGLQIRSTSVGGAGTFYCEKQKLNQPVLLPDGELSICSFDYGFRCTYGNLFSEKLSVLRSRWLGQISDSYSKGTLNPCTECEHYRQLP